MDNTIELEIPVLLPGVEDEQDQCVARLESTVRNHKGIIFAHLEPDQEPVRLCVHYDPILISIDDVRRLAKKTGAKIANRYKHILIPIEGMDCSDCALTIEHSVSRLDGVLTTSVSYTGQVISVEYDSHSTTRKTIERRIRQLGYTVPPNELGVWYNENRKLLFSLMAGLLLVIGWFGENILNFPVPINLGFYLAAYIFAGHDIARHAFAAVRFRQFDTDLLMIIAALGSAALGKYAEGALLLFLFSLGHALEEKALDRTRNAIHDLADFTPITAIILRNGVETKIAVDQLNIGDTVIIHPGTRIPIDGKVSDGHSSIDQSPVTGESIPVDKSPGDVVFAGSLNGEGAIEVLVSRLSKDSTLSRVVEMVEKAQTKKSPTQLAADNFQRVFVPSVLIGALLLTIIPPLFGFPISETFPRALTLLVAASPCALALGTPAAVLSGLAQAARNGVLIKGGVHLENLGRLRAIAFDKTGTITIGEPTVTEVIAFNERSQAEVLGLAASVESRSAHPLALAIVHAANERGLDLFPAKDVKAVTGQGITASVNGMSVWIENPNKNGTNHLQSRVLNQVKTLERDGKTVILVSIDQTPIGAIAIADKIRPGVGEILADLKHLGMQHLVMLTGDNPFVAAQIAKHVGLEDTRASLLPEDKLVAVNDLLREYETVGMVGDGVNDAPAMAQATVGIAMGGASTDVALESADVALMADDLSRLPFVVGLGRATRAIIYQNLVIALGVITVLVILSITGQADIGAAIIFHEGSTLLVVLNALRLLQFRS